MERFENSGLIVLWKFDIMPMLFELRPQEKFWRALFIFQHIGTVMNGSPEARLNSARLRVENAAYERMKLQEQLDRRHRAQWWLLAFLLVPTNLWAIYGWWFG